MKIAHLYPLLLLNLIVLLASSPRASAQESRQPAAPRASDPSTDGQFNAATFPGSDICAKVNAAVAASLVAMKQPGIPSMAQLRGRVRIPTGNYTCSTAIHLPHGVWVSGDGDATFITWTGTGPAVIASEADVPGEYVQGVMSDLHIRGTETTHQDGIYVGGDVNCTQSCVANPATNIGYNYVFRNITIYNMAGNGIQYGHGAFNLLWDDIHADNNHGYGLYVPHTAGGGGQYNTWTHSQLSGNRLGGWFIDQSPFVTFEMFGMDVQYNVGNEGVPSHAEVTGGHVICVGCHFEHQQGAFFSLNSEEESNKGDDIQLVGGQLILVKRGGADPYLASAAGAARFSAAGTYIIAFHNVAQMVSVTEPASASISVFGTTVYSVGVRFGGITAAKGQGIRFEEPIDTVTQQPNSNGPRYFGGLSNFDTVTAGTRLGVTNSGNSWSSLPASGMFFGWNESQRDGEGNFFNAKNAPASTARAYEWDVNVDGKKTALGYFLRDGTFIGEKLRSGNGFTGTCTTGVVVTKGIVTGCR
jgi:hypothetical protein